MRWLVELIISASATLAAAYFGAKYAFALQAKKSNDDDAQRSVKAANRAIFELITTYNRFLAYRKQFIDPHRADPNRFVTIMPAAAESWYLPDFDMDAMGFMFTSAEPNALIALRWLQHEVGSTLEVIRRRSKAHLEEVQPRVEALSANREHFLPEALERSLGIRLSSTLRMETDSMLEGVDNIVERCPTLIKILHDEARRLFPDRKIISMKTSEFPASSEASPTSRDAQLDQYRAGLVASEERCQDSLDRTVLTLSGGGLGISLIFVKDFIGEHQPSLLLTLGVAWVSWALSCTSVLISHYFSVLALRTAIRQCDAGTVRTSVVGGKYSRWTRALNALSAVLFVFGLSGMLIFAMHNLSQGR